jgi:hypothetical protein
MLTPLHVAALWLLQSAPAEAIQVEPILVALAAALGLSVVLERVLEFSKNLLDLLPTKAFGSATYKPSELDTDFEQLQDRLIESRERALADEQVQQERKKLADLDARIEAATDASVLTTLEAERATTEAAFARALKDAEYEEGAPFDTLLVMAATDADLAVTARKFVLQMVAFAGGIVAARLTQLDLFNAFLQPLSRGIPQWFGFVLTGLFIGGGSGPVHTLIRFVTERKFAPPPSQLDEAPAAAPPATPATTQVLVTPSAGDMTRGAAAVAVVTRTRDWIDIPYQGGVDKELLESTHRRSGEPNLIIYHHTAMHLNSKFEDVVRVIKNRKDEKSGRNWITGYNCVVTADGGVHAFCRWDRYGNHAAGHNSRSLGITLNGNFETKERSKWSNFDGRYGPAVPPSEQLHAAARVVALWCRLYDIDPDFGATIIPHKQVSPKSCPGNSFPYAEFAHLVQDYLEKWQQSDEARDAIAVFKLKPYLYARR